MPTRTEIAVACFAPRREVAGSNAAAVARIQRCLREASALPVTTGCSRTVPALSSRRTAREMISGVASKPFARVATVRAICRRSTGPFSRSRSRIASSTGWSRGSSRGACRSASAASSASASVMSLRSQPLGGIADEMTSPGPAR